MAEDDRLEACAFKELGGRGAGQEEKSRETPPPSRSFFRGKMGRARAPFGFRPIFSRRSPFPPQGLEDGRSRRPGSPELPARTWPAESQVC